MSTLLICVTTFLFALAVFYGLWVTFHKKALSDLKKRLEIAEDSIEKGHRYLENSIKEKISLAEENVASGIQSVHARIDDTIDKVVVTGLSTLHNRIDEELKKEIPVVTTTKTKASKK